MDDLILKVVTGNATDLECHQVERWRRESAANERRYQEERRLWDAVGALPRAGTHPAPDVADLTAAAEGRRGRHGARARRRAVMRSPWLGYGAAAAVVALVSLAVEGRLHPEPAGLLAPVGSSSTAGTVVTMDLSDGSVIRLAPSTRVDFPPTRNRREVTLEGRAFFAVARGEVPFVVRTAAGSVTVHGTRFEVRAQDDQTRLVVLEGDVRLQGEGGGVDVGPGQVAYLVRGAAPSVVDLDDVWSLLDWGDGMLVYQATPLGQVAREVGRHFGREVRVDPSLAARRITAWFQDETLDEVVSAVCVVAGARCVLGDSLVTMTGR
ncbi:MAG TPA: FecR domain-containing protein [Longimicrobiales bacterium]|nr:FecR domain-containing protein [Longimicrobiales bacterium]